jgi:hypothetical protein
MCHHPLLQCCTHCHRGAHSQISARLCPDLWYQDHLVYHYIGGIVLAVLRRYEEATEFFELCVSAPVAGPTVANDGAQGPSQGSRTEKGLCRGHFFLQVSNTCSVIISIPLSMTDTQRVVMRIINALPITKVMPTQGSGPPRSQVSRREGYQEEDTSSGVHVQQDVSQSIQVCSHFMLRVILNCFLQVSDAEGSTVTLSSVFISNTPKVGTRKPMPMVTTTTSQMMTRMTTTTIQNLHQRFRSGSGRPAEWDVFCFLCVRYGCS